MNVVVVIATYNESSTIYQLLNKLRKYSVIIVDDNSPDGTGEIAKLFKNVEVITPDTRQGIARSYKLGFKRALELKPDYVIQMDAGFTHDPFYIEHMLIVALANDASLVYGSRFTYNVKKLGYRTYISLIGTWLMRFIGVDVTDATSGYRCWKASLLQKVVDTMWLSKGFSFQLETIRTAVKLVGNKGITYIAIPYKLTNSSFNYKTLLEAIWIYSILLMS